MGDNADWFHLSTFPPVEDTLLRIPQSSWTPGKKQLVYECYSIFKSFEYTVNTDFLRPIQWHIVMWWWLTRPAHLSTCGSPEDALPSTKKAHRHLENSFCRYGKCSDHLRWIKLWIETFWSYCSDMRCWLTRSEYLSACAIYSTKDQKAPQHLEIRFCQYKSVFCQIMLNQTMKTDFLMLLQSHAGLTE